jgi:hypothetical protein
MWFVPLLWEQTPAGYVYKPSSSNYFETQGLEVSKGRGAIGVRIWFRQSNCLQLNSRQRSLTSKTQ